MINDELKEAGRTLTWIGVALAYGLFATTVTQLIIHRGAYLISLRLSMQEWLTYAAIGIGNFVVMFPVFCLMTTHLPNGEKKSREPLLFPEFLIAMVISLSAMYIFNIIGMSATRIIGDIKGLLVVNPLNNLLSQDYFTSFPSFLSLFFVLVIGAPITEEYMFRKIIIDKLRMYGDKTAIFMSALMFGLFHGNFTQFFYAWALGIILGYIAVRTGLIRYSIILHMIINLFGGVIAPFVALTGIASLLILSGFLIIVIIFAGIILFILHYKTFYFEEGSVVLDADDSFYALYLNWGMIVFFIVSGGCFVISVM